MDDASLWQQIQIICSTLEQVWMPLPSGFQLITGAEKASGLASYINQMWAKLGKPCCICGSLEQVEMHHVRHIRKMGQRKATGFTAVLRALNRKQIPACKSCHKQIHRGAYDGISLSNLAYDPR